MSPLIFALHHFSHHALSFFSVAHKWCKPCYHGNQGKWETKPWGGMRGRWVVTCVVSVHVWILAEGCDWCRPELHTVTAFHVCSLSGEIKANDMWQMKKESWAPSVPSIFFTLLVYTVTSSYIFYMCSQRPEPVPEAFCLPFSNGSLQTAERWGSHVEKANGQLMDMQTARLVPKCLQIKQFIIFIVHSKDISIHTSHVHTPRHSPEAYLTVNTDCSTLVNIQLSRRCVWSWQSVSLRCGLQWPAKPGITCAENKHN